MVSLGVTVRQQDTRPVVYVCSGVAGESPRTWSYRSSKSAESEEQLFEIARAFKTFLTELDQQIDVVVVREGDDGRRAGETKTRKTRFRIEGCLVASAREQCQFVQVLSGKSVASSCGAELSDLDLQSSQRVGKDYVQAASALQAAIAINGSS